LLVSAFEELLELHERAVLLPSNKTAKGSAFTAIDRKTQSGISMTNLAANSETAKASESVRNSLRRAAALR
jgi:hypothetical protein